VIVCAIFFTPNYATAASLFGYDEYDEVSEDYSIVMQACFVAALTRNEESKSKCLSAALKQCAKFKTKWALTGASNQIKLLHKDNESGRGVIKGFDSICSKVF
jgi:hypothetical protein